jgi:hypothetical protein
MFHTRTHKLLGTTVQNLVILVDWCLDFVHPSFKYTLTCVVFNFGANFKHSYISSYLSFIEKLRIFDIQYRNVLHLLVIYGM